MRIDLLIYFQWEENGDVDLVFVCWFVVCWLFELYITNGSLQPKISSFSMLADLCSNEIGSPEQCQEWYSSELSRS